VLRWGAIRSWGNWGAEGEGDFEVGMVIGEFAVWCVDWVWTGRAMTNR
jgi:hypothetical protein